MKKLFLGLAVVAGSMAFAQQFGVKAGGDLSHLSGKDAKETNSRFGYYAGVFANVPVGKDFSIQPEVLYNSLGFKTIDAEINNTKLTQSNSLDYVSIPVMVQYNVVPNFYVEAGPEFSFLVAAKSKAKVSGSIAGINIPTASVSVKDAFNTFNFGMGIGAGYNFTKNIGINARYTAGLTDIDKVDNASAKVNGLQLGVNYKF